MPGKTAGHEASNLSGNQKLTYGSLSDQKAPLNPRVVAASGLPAVCICILAVELCERLAFYTFTGTQESFLEHLGYSLSQAGGLNAAVGTLCMTWALLAGWVADCVLGRYRTILYFGLIYAFGSVVAAAGAFPLAESSRWYLTGVMVLVPIGTAGITYKVSCDGGVTYSAVTVLGTATSITLPVGGKIALAAGDVAAGDTITRSEEHTSELQSP